MKHINPNIPPPNGYKFLNYDGVRITGNGWTQLERKLLEYRRRTGGKTDNLWEEILNQVCASAPGFCKEGEPRAGSPDNVGHTSKARAMNWLSANVKNAGTAQVSREVASERAKTCLACAHRRELQIGCSGCNRSMVEMRKKILSGATPVSPTLGTCDILGCDLAVATHLNDGMSDNSALPGHCWRKRK